MGSKLASAIRQRRAAVGVRGRWRLNLALVATSLSLLSLLAVPIAVRATSQSSSSTNGPVVPLYGQQWDPWGPQDLGTSSSSIANEGCALTASAMLLAAYGVNTNPGALNQWLISNGGYVDQDLLVWGAVAQFAQAQGVDVSFVSTQGYNLAAIDSSLAAGNPVIAQVTLDGNMHFVLITGTGPDGTLWMNDPWTGDHTTFQSRYGSPATGIDSIRIYSGPPAASASMTAMSAGGTETISAPGGGLGSSGDSVLVLPYSTPTANWLDGTPAQVISQTASQLEFTAPEQLSAGFVVVETAYGDPNFWFPYTSPALDPVSVSALTPRSGSAGGGSFVSVQGAGFQLPVAVTFGAATATTESLQSDAAISVLAPAGSGDEPVTVSDWMGTSPANSAAVYSYGPSQLPATCTGVTVGLASADVVPGYLDTVTPVPQCPTSVGAEFAYFTASSSAGPWTLVQGWTGSPWTWNTTGLNPGNHYVLVWVSDGPYSVPQAQSTAELTTSTSCTGVTVGVSGQTLGQAVTVSAQGICPAGSSPEYSYFVRSDNGSEPWALVAAWIGPQWSWNTAGLTAGTYQVLAWVSSGPYSGPQAQQAATETLSWPAACTASSVSVTSDSTIGEPVSVSSSATCPNGASAEFSYFTRPGESGPWTLQAAWVGSSWTWVTADLPAGQYQILVWASDGPFSLPQVQQIGTVDLEWASPCTAAGLTAAGSPGATASTFEGSAICPTGANPEYSYFVRPGDSGPWSLQAAWIGSSWTWLTSGLPAGPYQVLVWVSDGPFTVPQAQAMISVAVP